MAAGRPPKLTAEAQERILNALAAGNYIDVAAASAGVGEATFYRWMQRGAEHRAPALYRDFREAVLRVRAEAEVRAVVHVQQAMRGGTVIERRTIERKDGTTETVERLAPPDPRAAEWYLERSFPKRWGRRTLVEVSGVDGGDIPVAVTTTARDALGDALDLIARRVQAARQIGDEHAARALDVDSVEKAGDGQQSSPAGDSPAAELAEMLTERGR